LAALDAAEAAAVAQVASTAAAVVSPNSKKRPAQAHAEWDFTDDELAGEYGGGGAEEPPTPGDDDDDATAVARHSSCSSSSSFGPPVGLAAAALYQPVPPPHRPPPAAERAAPAATFRPAAASGDPAASLRQHFGHDAFRAGQGAVVAAVLAKRDVAVFWTTGSGKSLCYQLPSLHLGHGTFTVVVSPLLALIQDQVRGWRFFNLLYFKKNVRRFNEQIISSAVRAPLEASAGRCHARMA
jgi:superfamily II DNA helicase RecQ